MASQRRRAVSAYKLRPGTRILIGVRADEERDYVQYVEGRILVLRRTAYRLCGDWQHAHDLVQTTLIQLYQQWRHAQKARAPDAYVRQILVNVFLENERRRWTRKVDTVAELPQQAGAAEPADHSLVLRAALDRLSRQQRAMLVLRFWEGLDVNETAVVMDCSPGAVKGQTSNAIAALRRLLPDYLSETK